MTVRLLYLLGVSFTYIRAKARVPQKDSCPREGRGPEPLSFLEYQRTRRTLCLKAAESYLRREGAGPTLEALSQQSWGLFAEDQMSLPPWKVRPGWAKPHTW